jgi:hypothetical protein
LQNNTERFTGNFYNNSMDNHRSKKHSHMMWKSVRVFVLVLAVAAFVIAASAVPGYAGNDNMLKGMPRNRDIKGCKPATWPHRLLSGRNYLFGVINDTGDHFEDEWAHGVRATTLEFQWKMYETADGVYDQGYIDHMKQRMADLKQAGWYVQLVPGSQYTPAWVFTHYNDMRFVNQYGEPYTPSTTSGDMNVTNAIFNPQARQLIARYLRRIFLDFPQADPSYRFDSVRVGGGVQGELRYPPAVWNGHSNSYWAFDVYAQDGSISGIPANAAGWRPGIDPNPGTLGRGQLVLNAGFEESHPFFTVPSWAPDKQVTIASDPGNPHSGSRSLRVELQTADRVHQFVKVQPGMTYDLSGWLRSGDGVGNARIIAVQYGSDHQPVPGASFLLIESSSKGWSQVSGSIQLSASTKFLKVELDGDRPGKFFFDDLSLIRQGDPNPGGRDISVPTAFYEWYVSRLTAYQNWQIDELRTHYNGQLDVLYPGKGILADDLIDALSNDLAGDGWNEDTSALYAGTFYQVHSGALPENGNLTIFLTGIEDPPEDLVDDSSPYPNDWSAARWIAHLAHSRGLDAWGENSGRNNKQEMELTLSRMYANGYVGVMWGFESEMYSGQYATINDYQTLISYYSNLMRTYLPVVSKCR